MNTIAKNCYRASLLAALALCLSACASQPQTSSEVSDAFVLERDLVGETLATGSFSAIDGTEREFVVRINGSWDGKAVTLVEDFVYSDGVEERKTWVFTKLANGEFSGIREDVVGTARGFSDGKVFRLDYIMAIPDDDGKPGRKLRFRDILYNQTDGTIRNDATVGLFGFRVATVNLIIERS